MNLWGRLMRAINGQMKEGHTPVQMWRCPFDGGQCSELMCSHPAQCKMKAPPTSQLPQRDWRYIFRQGAQE